MPLDSTPSGNVAREIVSKSEVDRLISRFEWLRQQRRHFDSQWRPISRHMRLERQEWRYVFWKGERPPVSDPYITDSTAYMAVDNFKAGMFSALTNPANMWVAVKTFDDELNEFHSAKRWLNDVSRIVLKSYGPAVSAFYPEAAELFADTPTYGTGVFYSEWKPGRGGQIFDKCFSIFDCYPDVNQYGEVDSMARHRGWTPRQVIQEFGAENVSDDVKSRAERSADMDKVNVLHWSFPNQAYEPNRFGIVGFPYLSVYVELDKRALLRVGGVREFAYQVPRWSGNDKYGFGLGRRVLPDVKTLNSMDRAGLEWAEWQARPSIFAPDEDAIETLRPVPRGVTYGAISRSGRRLVDFVSPTGNMPVTREMLAERRQQLKDAWYFSLLQLDGRTGLSPQEFLEHQLERIRLLGPGMTRLQNEFLSPHLGRRIAMLDRHGALPPPPDEIRGQQLRADFISPMARALKADEARTTLRWVEGVGLIAQVDPEAADVVNGTEASRVIHEGYGVPAAVFNSPERIAERRNTRKQQQQMTAALQAGEASAGMAQQLGMQVPGAAAGAGNA